MRHTNRSFEGYSLFLLPPRFSTFFFHRILTRSCWRQISSPLIEREWITMREFSINRIEWHSWDIQTTQFCRGYKISLWIHSFANKLLNFSYMWHLSLMIASVWHRIILFLIFFLHILWQLNRGLCFILDENVKFCLWFVEFCIILL